MIIKYFGSAVLVSSDATQMIKAMTEKAFRKAPRFLYFDGVGSCQPLTHDVRPTKSDSHQKLEVNICTGFQRKANLCRNKQDAKIVSMAFKKMSLDRIDRMGKGALEGRGDTILADRCFVLSILSNCFA